MAVEVSASSSFSNKVAFATGAGSGLGKAFALAVCQQGVHPAIVNIDKEAGSRAADGLTAKNYSAAAFRCNVTDEAAVCETVEQAVARFGGIDILVINAALHSRLYNQNFKTLGVAQTRRLSGVDLIGQVICSLACRAAVAKRGSGVILDIASIAGYYNETPYGVAKLAVRGLTVTLASQLPRRIFGSMQSCQA